MWKGLRSCLVVSVLVAPLAVGCTLPIDPIGGEAFDPPAPGVLPAGSAVRAWSADESNAARVAIRTAYQADPAAYWAVHGLPALARSADLRERDGIAQPDAIFDGVMKGFERERFFTACELAQVHPMICERAMAASDPAVGLPRALRSWVARGDEERFSRRGPGPIAEQTTRGLREVLTTSFSSSVLVELAPTDTKTTDTLPTVAGVVCSPPGGGAEGDAGTGLTWEKVADSSSLAGGKPDGMCVTKAVGVCTQRLGMRNATVTPEAWQKLSAEVGANAQGGGSIAGMKQYFESNGYGFSEAWDGPLESATLEAKRALERGCDVFLWYDSGEKTTHIEVVEDVSVKEDGEAVVSTNSWGQSATAKVKSGTYSQKSDIGRYGDFRASAKATLYYACAKK